MSIDEDAVALKRNLDDNKQAALQKRIARADEEIDQIVYELYGLTEEEIRIVEGR